MAIHKDWREFIGLLNAAGVDYVIVGASAMALHGIPRLTGDIDFLVRPNEENAGKIVTVLENFGFRALGVRAEDFMGEDALVQLGYPPYRIDILTGIDGVPLEDALSRRIPVDLDGVPTYILDKDSLIRNKRATGRPQDLADLAILEGPD
jgi:hypothetical protein